MRLDRFIARNTSLSERDARIAIIRGEALVDGEPALQHYRQVDRHCGIRFGSATLQRPLPRVYLMMNKPRGVVSATTDARHRTALDLIDHPLADSLHLVGRLDRSSSGLLLLTNDSVWSQGVIGPGSRVEKAYLVETDQPIPEDAEELFARGFHFLPEDVVTRPARLVRLGPCRARIVLTEGRYHQIKRMFYRIGEIRLCSLHRERIGALVLPPDWPPGQWGEFSPF